MNAAELNKAYKKKRTIENSDGAIYVILGLGLMKVGDDWFDSCTYMNVKTKASCTRKVDDFEDFEVRVKV